MTIEEIITAITEADKQYYTNGTSSISDYEYDNLKRALAALDPNNPLLNSLGEDHTEGYTKVTHPTRMLSLEKIQANKEDPTDSTPICTWIHARRAEYPGEKFVVEPKVDGMSAELIYKNGVLESASTRGNGDQGDDITGVVEAIVGKQAVALTKFPCVCVRGELYISKLEFERINKAQEAAGLPIFANARNLCAGTVKCTEATDRKVSFVAHGFGKVQGDKLPTSYEAQMDLIRSAGFDTVPHVVSDKDKDLWDAICDIDKNRATYEFCIDGAVVKMDNLKIHAELGETEHHPRWAVAYKFVPETKYTIIRYIDWQVGGKTGKITPVAVFDPITLCGSVVSKASLANAGLMAHKGVKVGSLVLVEKANEIIPHVVEVVEGENYAATLPKAIPCPACGSDAMLVIGSAAPTADYVCSNPDCCGKKSAALRSALGTQGLNVIGIGPDICDDFIVKYPTLDAIDIVGLAVSDYPDTLSDLQKAKLYAEVKSARDASLRRWIVALQIPGVSDGTASKISQVCKTMSDFAEALKDPMIPLPLSAARRAACHQVLITDGALKRMLDSALNPVSDNYIERAEGGLPLDNLNFVVTGTFQYGRKKLEELIVKLGGAVKGSVSKKTHCLVMGADVGATKINKAKELGTAVVTEAEFFELVETKKSELNSNADNQN